MSIAVMSRLFRMSLGTCERKLLAIRLADFADDEGRGIYPTVARLARETDLSERTVQRKLKEFVDEGLLVIVSEASGRPGQATRYDFDMAMLDRIASGKAVPLVKADLTGDSVSPVAAAERGDCQTETGDCGTETGDTDDRDGCPPVTRTVIEPSNKPLSKPSDEREGGREVFEESKASIERDDPARLAKRIKALELGRAGNPWPGALGSSTDWALRQFEKLSVDERRMAEDRRDGYLALCLSQKTRPVALGVYLRDRKFLDVAAQAAKAVLTNSRIAVAPFGPLWAGLRAWSLMKGPIRVELPGGLRQTVAQSFEALRRRNPDGAEKYLRAKGLWLAADGWVEFPDDFEAAELARRMVDAGYPEVNELHRLAASRERGTADSRMAGLAELCEAVPVDSVMFAAWRAHDEAHGWPLVPDVGAMRVVYFPKGGPERIEEFRRAAATIMAPSHERIEGHVHAAAE